ncbi:MAG TPA: hypothetical protein GXX35_12215 [Thermoanaerobacterales bacterium]|nr:hypothetical protein [Thermoanaerobacterales bacterium]
MPILIYAVVIGIVIVVFYLFLKRLFNEDRLNFPKDSTKAEEKKEEGVKAPIPEESMLGKNLQEETPTKEELTVYASVEEKSGSEENQSEVSENEPIALEKSPTCDEKNEISRDVPANKE